MRKSTRCVAPSRPKRKPHKRNDATGDPKRIASLARLNFFNQSPVLVLPTIADQPTSYSRIEGSDTSILLAESFVKAGLGSIDLWKHANGNCAVFNHHTLNNWLEAIGAKGLSENVELAVTFTTSFEAKDVPANNVLATIETECAGYMCVGQALSVLEQYEPGLGRDFYMVLICGINRWMNSYTIEDARVLVDHWRGSISYEIEPETDSSEEYCDKADISFPDVDGSEPPFLKDLHYSEVNSAVRRLKARTEGRFKDIITPVLEIWSTRPTSQFDERFRDNWDDGPVPSWLIGFHEHDAISQCFDEESTGFREVSREPSWFTLFDPADVKQLKRVLADIRRFAQVNMALAQVSDQMREMEKRGNDGIRLSGQGGEFRAA